MALHWMIKDHGQVVRNIHNTLKKHGRFVAELIGEGGWDSYTKHAIPILISHRATDAIPLYLSSKETYAELLESEGFEIKHISILQRERLIPGGTRTISDIYITKFVAEMGDHKKEQVVVDSILILLAMCLDLQGDRRSCWPFEN